MTQSDIPGARLRGTATAVLLAAFTALSGVEPGAVDDPGAVVRTPAECERLGWPMLHGPFGNFQSARGGIALVTKASDIRKAWESEYRDIGFGKAAPRPLSVIKQLNDPKLHQGGFSSPIVAAGCVFVSHFRPSGDVRFTSTSGRDKALADEVLTVAADDVVVAIDAASGATRWVAAQAGKGMSRFMGKRGGWGPTPVFHEGRVFAIGTTGRIYALDAADGRLVWESDLGAAHQAAEALKAKAMAAKIEPDLDRAWNSSPVVAGGVLVVPDYASIPQHGLRGHACADGRLLWERPGVLTNTATPSIVRIDGAELLLSPGGIDGKVHLIDPRDGALLWTLEGLGPNRRTLTPVDRMVLLNIKPAVGADGKKQLGRFACYRIARAGAERIWELPEESDYGDHWSPDTGAHRYMLARDGVLHLFHFRDGKVRGNTPTAHLRFAHLRIRLADGTVLARSGPIEYGNMAYLCEDRLVSFADLIHHPDWGRWFLTPEATVVETKPDTAAFQHRLTSGYELQMEFPYVAGRMYMRTIDGRVVCYDLRRQ